MMLLAVDLNTDWLELSVWIHPLESPLYGAGNWWNRFESSGSKAVAVSKPTFIAGSLY